MTRLSEYYQKSVMPVLQKELGITNPMALPRLWKVVVNVGMGRVLKDPAAQQTIESTLQRVTGQKPVLTKARKSIASFKIREGMVIGAMVTLRGHMMEEFVDKLIHITFPRVRDFRGIDPRSVSAGTLTVGFHEHTVFPEIRSDEIEKLHGLEVTIVSSAKTREQALILFKALGFPFSETAAQEKLQSARQARKSAPASKK